MYFSFNYDDIMRSIASNFDAYENLFRQLVTKWKFNQKNKVRRKTHTAPKEFCFKDFLYVPRTRSLTKPVHTRSQNGDLVETISQTLTIKLIPIFYYPSSTYNEIFIKFVLQTKPSIELFQFFANEFILIECKSTHKLNYSMQNFHAASKNYSAVLVTADWLSNGAKCTAWIQERWRLIRRQGKHLFLFRSLCCLSVQ